MADETDEKAGSAAPIVLAHSPAFRIGDAEVRPATRELVGPGGSEIVEPRVMQVLVALARAEGAILSRDDLIQACWEGRIVSENAIDRVISKLRRLAETVADGSFRIETITKVGYRLLAEDGAPESSASALQASAVPPGPAIGRRTWIAGAAALAVGGAGIWLGTRDRRPDVPPAAAEHYERGVESLRRGWAEDRAHAVSTFREVVALAPDYADGWGMLALAYELNVQFAPPEQARAVRERARSAARRALELDPGNANALAAQALAVPTFGNWADAEAALRRVLVRDPQQVESCGELSRVLADVGRYRDALIAFEPIATAAGELPMYQYWRAWLLFCANRLDESDRVMDRIFESWPRQFAVWFTRVWLYAYTGRAAQALALVSDVANRPLGIPDRDFEIVGLSVRAIMTRSPADVEAAVRANVEAAPAGVGFSTNAVKVSAHLGRLDEAFAVAEALFLGRGQRVATTFFTPQQGGYIPPDQRRTELLFSPPCRPLRADPRFQALLRETGLADYWRRTGTAADAFG